MFYSKCIENYNKELKKHEDPYEYYTEYLENNKEGLHDCDPFICIEENDTHRIYEIDDFYIYESKNGVSSDREKSALIQNAIKLNADLIYSDSDFIDNTGKRHTPFFKPDWSPDLYGGYDYITEFYAIKKELNNIEFEKINKISHITKVLFHNISNNNSGEIYNKINSCYKTPDYEKERMFFDESVSIVIPSKDNPVILEQCLKSIEKAVVKSGLNEIETIIMDNGSTTENRDKITGIIDKYTAIRGVYVYEPADFNFSMMCDRGVNLSKGKYLLFLNDDVEALDDLFIIKLLHYARKEHVGACGAKLYYPNGDKIQHTGITALKMCGPSHKLSTYSDSETYYYAYNKINRNTLAVTGACLMVSREKYFLTGGFYDKMKVGYNDVDLCVNLYEKGYYNVIVNDTILYHHESVTRGSDSVSDEKYNRLVYERNLLYERHPFLLDEGDPFYNENLLNDSLDYKVFCVPDSERRDYRSKQIGVLERFASKHLSSSSRNTFCSIDAVSFEREIFNEGDYVSISGWGLINKKNNAIYDRYLCLIDGEKASVFTTAPCVRTDVTEAFKDTKNSRLAGFCAKIPAKLIEKDKEYKYGVVFVSKVTGKKYYAGYDKSNI